MDLFQKDGNLIHFIWQINNKKTAEKTLPFFDCATVSLQFTSAGQPSR